MVATLSSRISFSSGVGSRLSSSILTDSVSREMRKRRTSSSNLSRPEAESERSGAAYQCLHQRTQLIVFETELKELSNILIFPWMVIYLESFCPKWSNGLPKSERKNNFIRSLWRDCSCVVSTSDSSASEVPVMVLNTVVPDTSTYLACINCNWTMSMLYIS